MPVEETFYVVPRRTEVSGEGKSRRMITEAVMIGEIPDDMTMNGKNEWSFIKLAKVQVQ